MQVFYVALEDGDETGNSFDSGVSGRDKHAAITTPVIATLPLIFCHFLTKPEDELVGRSGRALLLELICHI